MLAFSENKQIITTSGIHSSGVRKMQTRIQTSTDFGQSKWLVRNLSPQRGGGRTS